MWQYAFDVSGRGRYVAGGLWSDLYRGDVAWKEIRHMEQEAIG